VAFVAPSVDDGTQSVLIKAPVAQRGGQFRADQFVRVRLIWSAGSGLKVPVVAVRRISGQFFVFVAEAADGGLVAHQRLVRLGDLTGDGYVLLGGLEVGEQLIVGGVQKIGEGSPVQELPAGPPSDAPGRGGR
jgi:multidrug efflux pump subunit AcrA (membrane-fusion protein)